MTGTIHRPLQIALAALFAGLTLAAGRAPAAPLTSDMVVKATAVAEKPGPDGKQTVTLTLTIDKGWHLYANPVGLEDLAAAQTKVVNVKAKEPLDNVKIDYPPGKKIKDAVGEYRTYEDTATITVRVNRAKGDDSPLELTVKIQACNESSCRLPSDLKVTAAP